MIFRITKDKEWILLAEYDGWPHGLKCPPEGRITVADPRQGLVEINPDTGKETFLVSGYRGERFRGLNELTLGADGWVYVTDQGQSSQQETSGCVYRWHCNTGTLEILFSNISSPNGLVLSADEHACLWL